VHAHKTEVSQLDGLGRVMPWTFGAFAVGSLGLAGIPPLTGFVSKWWIGLGAMEAGQDWALVVLLLSGVLNAGYFFPIVIRGFFYPAPPDGEGAHDTPKGEASPWLVAPLCTTAALAVVFGVFPNFPIRLFDFATLVAEAVTGGAATLPGL
jgi:multicomponent Na+:H+ antiporter subunit D